MNDRFLRLKRRGFFRIFGFRTVTPRFEFHVRPLLPTDVETPLRETFSRTPGAIPTDFRSLNIACASSVVS